MNQVYESIFKVVDDNLKQAGVSNDYKVSTFLADIGQNPHDIDLQRILLLDKEEFVEASYMVFMKRLPDPKELDFWKMEQHEETLKKRVMETISNSPTVMINYIHMLNCPYEIRESKLKQKLFGLLYGLTDKSYLREFGKKMPLFVQILIRRLFF